MKDEVKMDNLYTRWCIAEFETDCLYDELDEDFTHPRFLKAADRSRRLLVAFLNARTRSLRHIQLKLRIACDVEDYLTDVKNPACREVAPYAVVGAMVDLQGVIAS